MMSVLTLVGLASTALLLHALWAKAARSREQKAENLLEDMAALGEIIPDTLHPRIDVDRCIGSGACVRACPEKNVLEVVHGRATVVNVLGCVGHAACMHACPVRAIEVVFGTAKRGVELPKVDPNFQTTREGVYVIGELGGMGLIRNAIRQGVQAADHVIASSRRGASDAFDAVVVGAGPAGISAALRLLESGLRVALVEREAFGGTIMHYPRAKVVMTGPLEIPLFGKIRRRKMSKEQLLEIWNSIREKTGLPVETGELVEGIRPDVDGMWVVRSSRCERRAANVLLALGRRGSPRKLSVLGEDLPSVHYRLLEPKEFAGKHMLVVGGGNSAVESAIALARHGDCASVSLSYRRAAFARCRADNRRQIDDLLATGKVRGLLSTEVTAIEPKHVALRLPDGSMTRQRADALIIQIGGTAPSELLATFGVQVVTKYGEA